MITVADARQLIRQHAVSAPAVTLPLKEAAGLVLSEPVISPFDTPDFHQSAMDGYAFSFADWDGASTLLLVGEVKAGQSFTVPLQPGETLRIFTGAPLPAGTDTVVIQEKVAVEKKQVRIMDDRLFKGANVRPAGSQTKKNEVALDAGQRLNPAAISLLAGMGITKVAVHAKPRISILVTGNELVPAGEEPGEGMIYESNSAALVAALQQMHINPRSVAQVEDDRAAITEVVRQHLTNDILIITGGISAGDYDFVKAALQDCGVEELFHSVRQKPGKPVYFGKHLHTLVFALPGNPAAVLTCFYAYIAPAIGQFTHQYGFPERYLPLLAGHTKKPGMTHFLKAKCIDDAVLILPDQESYKMNSFAVADCLVELEEEKELFNAGEEVKVIMIV